MRGSASCRYARRGRLLRFSVISARIFASAKIRRSSASEPRLATSEASSLALEGSFASGATLTGPFDPVRGAQSLFASNLNFFDFNFLNA